MVGTCPAVFVTMLAQLAAGSALLVAGGVQPPMLKSQRGEAPGCRTTIAARVPVGPGRNDNIGCRTGRELAHADVGAQHDAGAARRGHRDRAAVRREHRAALLSRPEWWDDRRQDRIIVVAREVNLRADVRMPSALPRPLSSFIGREDVLAEAAQLLHDTRLLTLTGPGGSGKTRLGIELATRVGAGYPDGAHFVPLAAIRDPALVPSSIAQSLGLQDARDRPLAEHLASYLSERTVLLVLDNFEQLLPAANLIAELLAAGGGTRVVVTSRSPLHLSGEQEFPVPPLPVPGAGADTSAAALAACESASLFVARAKAVAPDFTVDENNAAAIAGIVRRLDGLPLAIELAAARVKLLPPAGLLARLDHSLGLLVGGSRDLPDRQQTLRSTIAWSYDLLSDAARRLLAVLAVFRGGTGLAVLESVCAASIDPGVPVLEAVQELLD